MATKVKSFKEQRVEYKAKLITLLGDLQKAKVQLEAAKLQLPDVEDKSERETAKAELKRMKNNVSVDIPEQIEETARQYALADLAHMAQVYQELMPVVNDLEVEMKGHERDMGVFSERNNKLSEWYSVAGQSAKHDKEAVEEVQKEYRKRSTELDEWYEARKKATREAHEKLGAAKNRQGAMVTRTNLVYKGADIQDRATWARPAHNFGEAAREWDLQEIERVFRQERE